MANTRRIGDKGEDLVVELLKSRGFEILDRNFRMKFGELDIVAMRGRCVHFVEVKARWSSGYGHPAESVIRRKQQTIRKLADCYIRMKNLQGYDVSFDVAELEINLIENCF